MKKLGVLLLLAILIINIFHLTFVKAEDLSQIPSIPPGIQKITNLAEKASNPEQLKEEIRNKYLNQEWGKILEKNRVLGPIHKFFINNPLIFQILFKEPYNLSLIFFLIIILWLFAMTGMSDLIRASKFVKGPVSLLIGAGVAVILAQTGLFKSIILAVLDIIFSKDKWWLRVLFWFIAAFVVTAAYYLNQMLANKIKEFKKAKETAIEKTKLAVSSAFVKGSIEGKKFIESLKK